jgi:hypothetical protein
MELGSGMVLLDQLTEGAPKKKVDDQSARLLTMLVCLMSDFYSRAHMIVIVK